MSLCFGSRNPELIGYTDADMAGDIDSRKSTSGFLITFSGGAVSWQSKLQKCVVCLPQRQYSLQQQKLARKCYG
jgi:hypothetical protein